MIRMSCTGNSDQRAWTFRSQKTNPGVTVSLVSSIRTVIDLRSLRPWAHSDKVV